MKTNRVCFSLLAAATLALVAVQPGNSAEQKFRVSGTVVDAGGKPVAGATVELFQYGRAFVARPDVMKPEQTATSGSAGTFEFTAPAVSTVIFARKEGFAPAWFTSWNPTSDFEGKLVLGGAEKISGVVMDDAEKPVADALVSLGPAYLQSTEEGDGSAYYLPAVPHQEMFSARTGPDGKFQIAGCPTNAAFDLVVTAPGKVLRQPRRDYVSLETMTCRPGKREVKLVMDAAGAVEGKIRSEQTGEPIARATVHLTPQRYSGSMPALPPPTLTGADGTFRMDGVPPGSYRIQTGLGTNQPPGLVAAHVNVNVAAGRTTRDIEIAVVKGGLLEVTVVGKEDQKRIPEVNVGASSVDYNTGGVSDTNGIVLLRLLPGSYTVNANLMNSRSEQKSATVEAGATNRLQLEIAAPRQVKGIVLDPAGKPAADLPVRVFPEWRLNLGPIKTDANGKFAFPWNPSSPGLPNENCCVVVRDLARNLAAAEDLSEETQTLELKLQPGLSVSGRVEDLAGKPLSSATVTVFFWAGNSGFSFENKPTRVNAEGRFEIKGLPPGRRYSSSATAKGYGSQNQEIRSEDAGTNSVELDPFALNVADRKLAGQVVDADDKPVANAWVNMYGQGQPNSSARSDDQGYFKFDAVCEGSVQLSASAQSSFGNVVADAGDTNVVLKLGVSASSFRPAPSRPSLKGKPLPDLAEAGLSKDAVPAGKPVLLCLVDIDQRPCRRFIKALVERHDTLRQQGVTVLALQAAPSTDEALKEWREANPVPFQLVQLTGKSSQAKWASDVESFPWLILADKEHKVAAEGFPFEDLEAKLREMSDEK